MSREYPDWINPWKAAEGRRIYRGTVPLVRLERLSALLEGVGGEARFTARIGVDEESRPRVDLEVEAELPLLCQASLERFVMTVDRRVRLVVIADIREQELLAEDVEATCAEHGRLSFERLIEDELILAVPQVPRNPGLEAVAWNSGSPESGVGDSADTHRPFAGLADLVAKARTGQD